MWEQRANRPRFQRGTGPRLAVGRTSAQDFTASAQAQAADVRYRRVIASVGWAVRAAVAQNAVTDMKVMWGLSDLQSWTEWELGGRP
jgi:hypothetical protein